MISTISNLLSIITPIVLILWFYYSQRKILSKNYFDKLGGVYAGYVECISMNSSDAGIIMNIREVDNNGYFIGEFDHTEIKKSNEGNISKQLDGIYTFTDKLEFKTPLLLRDKSINPYIPSDNRVYKGRLFLVDRLDFQLDNYQISDYVKAEYEVIHYREMQVFIFEHLRTFRNENLDLPKSFTLYKKLGFTIDIFENVKHTVFQGKTRVDN